MDIMKKNLFKISNTVKNDTTYLRFHYANLQEQSIFFDCCKFFSASDLQLDMLSQMHTHDFFLIIYFRAGEGTLCVDFKNVPIEDNTIYFLSPNDLHSFNDLKNISGYAISFSEDFLLLLNNDIQNKLSMFIHHPTWCLHYCKVGSRAQEKIKRDLELIDEEFIANCYDETIKNDYLSALLSMFFLDCERLCDCEQEGRFIVPLESCKIYQRFLELLEKKFSKYHQVKEYASVIGVSPSVLSSNTQLCCGLTPLKIINNRIVLEAKRMLKYSTLSVKEISHKLGFNDPSYFNKFFRRVTGLSPAEFKNIDC